MKNKIVLPLLLIPILLLSACGSTATRTSSRTSSSTQGSANLQGLPLSEKLAVGTLKLEGTANAVTAKQAADLSTIMAGLQFTHYERYCRTRGKGCSGSTNSGNNDQ